MKEKGEFNVILGPNNLGKSTVAKRIAEEKGMVYLKYPLYELPPHGPIIDEVVHKKSRMDADELQLHYAENRRDFEPELTKILKEGKNVIAEDYTYTGITWGLVEGLSLYTLLEINQGLRKPDKYILIDGERFTTGREIGHRFEDDGDKKWQKARDIFKNFAKAYNWPIINANQTKDEVFEALSEILFSS